MELNKTESRALVAAMRDRVERVWLYEDVTLDIEELCQYNDGRGSCMELWVERDTRYRGGYRIRLRRWWTAAGVGWTVTGDSGTWVRMEKKSDSNNNKSSPSSKKSKCSMM